jgi:hypothetical protein
MILKRMGWEVMDCIHLAYDRDWWWASVSMVTKLRVPHKARNLTGGVSEWLLNEKPTPWS